MDQKNYLKKQRTYTVGYIVAALLTLFVYLVVMNKLWDATTLAFVALAAAALQLIVQSRFFLHLKKGERSPWKMSSYVFTWIMLLIVVVGSLWVMMNLNYNMGMSPSQMLEHIEKENTKGF